MMGGPGKTLNHDIRLSLPAVSKIMIVTVDGSLSFTLALITIGP